MNEAIQFTESQIHSIYNSNVKLPISYFKKYEIVPACPVHALNYHWQNIDFPRVWSTLDFKEWIHKYNIKSENMAYTCEFDYELEFIPYNKKVLLEYPPHDLHKLEYTEEFDFFYLIRQ